MAKQTATKKTTPRSKPQAVPAPGKRRRKPAAAAEDPAQDNPVLTVEQVPIGEVMPSPRNAREHDERNLAAIRSSLLEFGQVEPLLVQDSNMALIGGNGRLKVMQELGWSTVNIIRLKYSDMQSVNLGLTLNRTAELAHWNMDVLGEMMGELQGAGVTLNDFGWNDDELEAVMQHDNPAEFTQAFAEDIADEDDDEAPGQDQGKTRDDGDEDGPGPTPPSTSSTQQVQLLYGKVDVEQFYKLADFCAQGLGTVNLSETVLGALQFASDKLIELRKPKGPEAPKVRKKAK